MRTAYKVTLVYLLAASLWIAGSDWFFSTFFPNAFVVISVLKVWGFVAVTSACLLVLLERLEGERDAVEARLKRVTIYDLLTDTLNGVSVVFELSQAIHRARRNKSNVFAILVDIDDFRAVNEASGRSDGDGLLVEIGHRIQRSIRESDTLGRLGGDQFLIIVEDFRDNLADVVASKLLTAIAAPVMLEGGAVSVTASIGIAEYPDNAADAEGLIKEAESAMRSVKSAGKNNIALADIDVPMAF